MRVAKKTRKDGHQKSRAPKKGDAVEIFWEKEQLLIKTKVARQPSKETNCDVMFEKYTVRKAVILKYEKVQYYDNCTRYKTLSIPKKSFSELYKKR